MALQEITFESFLGISFGSDLSAPLFSNIISTFCTNDGPRLTVLNVINFFRTNTFEELLDLGGKTPRTFILNACCNDVTIWYCIKSCFQVVWCLQCIVCSCKEYISVSWVEYYQIDSSGTSTFNAFLNLDIPSSYVDWAHVTSSYTSGCHFYIHIKRTELLPAIAFGYSSLLVFLLASVFSTLISHASNPDESIGLPELELSDLPGTHILEETSAFPAHFSWSFILDSCSYNRPIWNAFNSCF